MELSKINKLKQHQYSRPKELMTLENSPKIKGYNFEEPFNIETFLQSLATTGFQATHLAEGIEIVKIMQREKAKIFLTFTGNMVSSGVREIIKYLVKHKKVHAIVTNAGGIEEDIIKCLKPFALGKFDVPGSFLFDHGINRIGNIYVPNDRYAYFDKWMQEFLKKIYDKQTRDHKIFCPNELIRELGIEIEKESNEKYDKNSHEDSIIYWAAKNNIPVFCPGIIDGSFGDMVYFFKQSHPGFLIDITKEMKDIVNLCLTPEFNTTGIISLGAGISKHFALNANIFKEGFDYAVYINTAQEFDGSDSGAKIEEAITWGKVKAKAPNVKINCDATIAFPLLVKGSFTD
jgi:deoxyhypusine synthase